MAVKKKQITSDFTTQIGRITEGAVAIYGAKEWLAPIARELNIGRSTLYRYLRGAVGIRNVDNELLALLASERIASFSRANRIAGVEKKMLNAIAASAAANAEAE